MQVLCEIFHDFTDVAFYFVPKIESLTKETKFLQQRFNGLNHLFSNQSDPLPV